MWKPVIFFLIISPIITFGNNLTATTNSPLPLVPDPRTISCSEKSSNGKIHLSCVGFTRIPLQSDGKYTSSPHEISVLQLGNGNHIQGLLPHEFSAANLINLQQISLTNLHLRTISPSAFSDLELLMELDLSNNNLKSLDLSEVFDKNDNLVNLILKNNPIHTLSGKFPSLGKLSFLDFSNCEINFIPAEAFQNLLSLKKIDLSSNKLKRVDYQVFEGLNQLTEIYLRGNAFTCDCHVSFLYDFLLKRGTNVGKEISCGGNLEALECSPVITAVSVIGGRQLTAGDEEPLVIEAFAGSDIGLQCVSESFPEVEGKWVKDGVTVRRNEEVSGRESDSGSAEVSRYRYNFSQLLTLHDVGREDEGVYTCVVGKERRDIFLNLTGLEEEEAGDVVTGGGAGRVWLWVLLALLVVLLLALVVVCVLIHRNREKEKQDRLKRNMMEKFKGSEIVIDDPSFTSMPKKTTSTATDSSPTSPLLPKDGGKLPDVTQGQVGDLSPSTIFSPTRPPSADLRRQFFASQTQSTIDDSNTSPLQQSRPGSSMSTTSFSSRPHHFNQSLDRRYPYFQRTSPYPYGRPWGSSQSLLPEGSRPLLSRQFSGPAYSSLRLPREYQRQPLPSSYITATLPRRQGSISPTESCYSAFSYRPYTNGDPSRPLIYDSVGPRTTADGGSTQSLNKIPNSEKISPLDSISQGLRNTMPLSPGRNGRQRLPPPLQNGSGGYHNHGHRGYFNFEPIQEVDGGSDDVLTVSKLPSNQELDELIRTQLSPKIHPQPPPPNPRKKAPVLNFVPERRRNFRHFDSTGSGSRSIEIDEGLELDGDRRKTSIENIIEEEEGTQV